MYLYIIGELSAVYLGLKSGYDWVEGPEVLAIRDNLDAIPLLIFDDIKVELQGRLEWIFADEKTIQR